MANIIKPLFDSFENSPQLTSVIFHNFKSKYVLNREQFIQSINEVTNSLLSVRANNTVVICFLKPCHMLPSIVLGILKVSSTFAFLDIKRPVAMLKNLQKYIAVRVLLVENELLDKLDGLCSCWKKTASTEINNFSFSILQSMNCIQETCFQSEVRNMETSSEIPIAYIVQTSGSTGQPKIVQVPHQCILPNIFDLKSQFNINSDDNILLCSPLTFDPSIIDIFLFCVSGCTLTIIPEEIKSIPKKLAKVIIDNKITVLQGTPSLITSLGDDFIQKSLLSRESPLKVLAFGGEICPSINKLRKWTSEGNKTMLFNLYGLTEVSCWATCCKINIADKFVNSAIPLGKPLSDTKLKLDDDGELQIGSNKRWCIIDDENFPEKDTEIFRCTGDITIQDSEGNIYFKERKDNIIKYKGKKLSFEKIYDILDDEQDLSSYSIHFDHKLSKLLLYLVLKEKKPLLEKERNVLILKLRKHCPNMPPIELFIVPYIPLTSHGKTDHRRLLLLGRRKLKSSKGILSNESCAKVLSKLWKEYTNQSKFTEDCNFIISGGNSISALQLSSNIEWTFQINVPELVEVILNSTFNDLVKLVQSYLAHSEKTITDKADSYDLLQQNFTLPPSKKICTERLESENQCYQVFSRQESIVRCTCDCDHSNILSDFTNDSHNSSFELKPMFKFDLKKCVDASPCVVHYLKSGELFCYIGSHAGIFTCLNIGTAGTQWESVLPNRIESSACLSSCGNCVFVGCYDSHLYCLDSKQGTILWKFKTGAEVKCSPVISSQNTIFVGSHDKHVYAIDIDGELLWKRKISSGSIFASPALREETKALCIATLDGIVSLLKMDSGDIVWSFKYGKPLFSSPRIISSLIYVGSTDGYILTLDISGNLKLKYKTNGPVFSSVANTPSLDIGIIFGCHDDNVYCISETSELLWKFTCDSPIYATPFIFIRKDNKFVVVASTKGRLYILGLKNGELVTSYSCPGEIFSSPVVVNNLLFTGCRDNNVYCFKIE